MIAMITTWYMIRAAQQRDPPTAASAHGDHVYSHPAHLSHFCVLRGTCTCSFESIGESTTKTGVAHTAEDTYLYLLSTTFSNKPPPPPAAQTLKKAVQNDLHSKSHEKPCRRSEMGSNYRYQPVLLYTAQRITVEFVFTSCL